MKSCHTAISLVLCLAGAGLVHAQERTPEEWKEIQERVAELSQPGPEHALLAAMAGAWDVTMTMWLSPGAEPMSFTGIAEVESILGGRYVLQRLTVDDPMMASEALGIIGFDRRSGEFTYVGLDSSGTYQVTAQGPGDASGRRAVLSGADADPVIGHTQIYDFVFEWPDDDTFVSQIIFKDDLHTRGGPPFKMVETRSVRRR